MTGKPFGLRSSERVALEGYYLLEMQNKIPHLTNAYLGYVCGIALCLEKIFQCGESGVVYPEGILALALGTVADMVALDQGVEPGCSIRTCDQVIELLLNTGFHFYPPFLPKQRVF